jgi:hypothetical protein
MKTFLSINTWERSLGVDIIGIVENSVMVAEEKLHCTYLDGMEDISWDNSNRCSRNLI